jgi:hypothetical protein
MAASSHTVALMMPLPTSGMWLMPLIGWPRPTVLCPFGLITPTSCPLRLASLPFTLVWMMAASLLPPSLLASWLLATLMTTLVTLLSSSLTWTA